MTHTSSQNNFGRVFEATTDSSQSPSQWPISTSASASCSVTGINFAFLPFLPTTQSFEDLSGNKNGDSTLILYEWMAAEYDVNTHHH
jgi:hypothetical protein